MKKIILVIIALAAIGLGVFVLTKDNSKEETTTPQPVISEPTTNSEESAPAEQTEANSVAIKGFTFTPNKLTIKKGESVTWTNQDSVQHDITPDNESADFMGSELLAQGESYSFTFNKAGTYTYHCSPHPNMTSTVEVTD